MPDIFERTTIWRNIDNVISDNDEVKSHKEALRTIFRKFRERAAVLVGHIAGQIPSLTIHDVSHLDALWETAELIVGEGYPFTPIEVFVLGGAILLHDSALCFEAYDNGRAGLRNTVEWRDSYAVELERDPTGSKDDLEQRADFAALRTLHAIQAEQLAIRSWRDADDKEMYLIDDYELRRRYGALIGKIAASHHWSIDRVAAELQTQYNAPGYYPREWRVDPIKLACVLRCADAAHIDDRRAPDFLHALLRRQGLSAAHWKAQNWLNRIDVDQQDPTGATLIITSSHSFSQTDADAWWVAFDAVTLVDTELRASNALLNSRKLTSTPVFKSQQIIGVTSPELMSNYIQTDGWEPRSAKLHVSNIEHLIQRLGGKSLYGDGDHVFAVAIREMLQNARDAVAARRIIDNSYGGRIKIALRKDLVGDQIWYLDIEDDGVGMSDSVITGPLLDFGTSFWASNLVREEFPGLRSSKFKSVGKFGIGFYSIFMIADSVSVSSRKYDEGLSDIRTLNFPNGLTLRPIMSRGRPENFSTSSSTKITMRLKKDILGLPDVTVKRNLMGAKDFNVPFALFIASLSSGADIDIFFKLNSEDMIHVHKPLGSLKNSEEQKKWLSDMSFANCEGNKEALPLIERDHNRLRPLIEDGEIKGLAALSIESHDNLNFLSAQTVGGFSTTTSNRGSTVYYGVMDYEPISAKREARPNPAVANSILRAWADEQVEILRKLDLHVTQWAAATYALSDLDLDPLPIFISVISMDGTLIGVNVDQLLEYMRSKPLAIFKSKYMDHVETYHSETTYVDCLLFRPIRNGNFLSLEYNNSKPARANSFVGCLYRHAEAMGYELDTELRENVANAHIGGKMDAVIIKRIK